MIRPPSSQKSYDLFYSGDPSVVQLPEGASDAIAEAHWKRLEVAIETGIWDDVLVAGSDVTRFTVRPLSTEHYGAIKDLIAAGLGRNGSAMLALRIALKAVSGIEGAKLKFVEHEQFGVVASLSFLEDVGLVGDHGLAIVRELGLRVLKKAQDAPPK